MLMRESFEQYVQDTNLEKIVRLAYINDKLKKDLNIDDVDI